jgi:Na+/H+ antiporter NhaD/arsenite permease-like protein
MSLISKILLFSSLILFIGTGSSYGQEDPGAVDHTEEGVSQDDVNESHHTEAPAPWSVLPFLILLIMIATGPLFYEHFWHKNYPLVAMALAGVVVGYYLFALHNQHGPVHALAEYVQFIALLTGLYVASGGIMIIVDKGAAPGTNIGLLVFGAIIANIIGTTGASMLLIRPFIRLNKNRIKAYHIIFFIFIVSNIGGSLTPIGDPPLFLGFLKGVPFLWTLQHNVFPWAIAIAALVLIFYVLDRRNKSDYSFGEDTAVPTGKVAIRGTRNFIWLAVIVGAVFLDPNVLEWVPGITYQGQKFSFLREIIMLAAAYFSYKLADKQAHAGNDFNFEPIREVAFIFVGIFGTMMPALELVSNYAQSTEGAQMISANSLYWGTGVLSGFLDNAPTYVNFLTAALAAKGGSINSLADVQSFASGGYTDSVIYLKAISIAAVFFGAMTYIGNGPNFMVKSIAEQVGIKMPSFFGYIIRFSIPFLLPLFVLIWWLFFA